MLRSRFGSHRSSTGMYRTKRNLKIRDMLESQSVPECEKDALIQLGLAEVQAARKRFQEDEVPPVVVRAYTVLTVGKSVVAKHRQL